MGVALGRLCGAALVAALVALVLAEGAPGDIAAAPSLLGQLDTTFAGTGIALTDVGTGDAVSGWQGLDVAPAPLRTISTVGTALVGTHRVLVAGRFGAGGQPDVSFSGGDADPGLLTAAFGDGTDTEGAGMALSSDGSEVVAGQAHVANALSTSGRDNILLARYSPTGELDPSFGTSAGATLLDAGADAVPRDLATGPDGDWYVAGTLGAGNTATAFVARFDTSGRPVTSFGAGGIARLDLSAQGQHTHGFDVLVDDSGRPILAGFVTLPNGDNQLLLARFHPNGQPDAAFGTASHVALAIGDGGDTAARSITQQPDGALVVAGSASDGGAGRALLARFTSDGQIDPSFSAGGRPGIVVATFGDGGSAQLNAVRVGTDGSMTATGSALDGGAAHRKPLVARYTATGDPATTITDGGPAPGSALLDVGDGMDAGAVALNRRARGYLLTVAGHAVDGGHRKLALVQFGYHAAPVADFTIAYDHHGYANKPARPGEQISFDPAPSSDADGQLASAEWDLGTGTLAPPQGPRDVVSAAFPAPPRFQVFAEGQSPPPVGVHTIRLRMTDDEGQQTIASHDVTVRPNAAPVPRLGQAPLGTMPEIHDNVRSTIPASASTDSDGAIVEYQWDLDGDGAFETSTGTTPSIQHTYDKAGSYEVRLRVTDDEGARTTGRFDLEVSGPAPGTVAWRKGTCHGRKPTIRGTAHADHLHGTSHADIIAGLGGNDVIDGRGGNDMICGNDGNDVLRTGSGTDQVYGGSGRDHISNEAGSSSHDHLEGEAGADTLTILGAAVAFGGAGNDTFDDRSRLSGYCFDYVTLYGGDGNDRFTTLGAEVDAGAGNDVVTRVGTPRTGACSDPSPSTSTYGGSGDDVLVMAGGWDLVFGGRGNDTIHGETGDDQVWGGAGTDMVYGDGGDDLASGDDGPDRVQGGPGDDCVMGLDGNDVVAGDDGADHVYGDFGDDTVNGDAGDDFISGGPGDDRLLGGPGNDLLLGGLGTNVLDGGAGTNISEQHGAGTYIPGPGEEDTCLD